MAALGLERKSHVRREFLPDVLPRRYQLRALFDQRVRGPRAFVGDVAWHRENFAILLQRTAGGNARTAILGGLHHKYSQRDPTDNAVTDWKVLWRGKCTYGEFRDDGAAQRQNLFRQLLILLRICLIDARTPHGYGFTLCRNRAAMPGRIDAPCHTAENHQTTRRQVTRQPLRHS